MRGVNFVTDADGKKVAVQLDLEQWGELWEDIYDSMVARERIGEEMTPLAEVERDLRHRGLID